MNSEKIEKFISFDSDEEAQKYLQDNDELLSAEVLESLLQNKEGFISQVGEEKFQRKVGLIRSILHLRQGIELVVPWLQCESWDASKAYLKQNEAEMVGDVGLLTMHFLLSQEPENNHLKLHFSLLVEAKKEGIDNAYTQLEKSLQALTSQLKRAARKTQNRRPLRQPTPKPPRRSSGGSCGESILSLVIVLISMIALPLFRSCDGNVGRIGSVVVEQTVKNTAPEVVEQTIKNTAPEVVEQTVKNTAPEVVEQAVKNTAPEVLEPLVDTFRNELNELDDLLNN